MPEDVEKLVLTRKGPSMPWKQWSGYPTIEEVTAKLDEQGQRRNFEIIEVEVVRRADLAPTTEGLEIKEEVETPMEEMSMGIEVMESEPLEEKKP